MLRAGGHGVQNGRLRHSEERFLRDGEAVKQKPRQRSDVAVRNGRRHLHGLPRICMANSRNDGLCCSFCNDIVISRHYVKNILKI